MHAYPGRFRFFPDRVVYRIDHIRKQLPPEEHYRHENMVPAIIDRDVWERVQILLQDKVKHNVRAASGKPFHRYAGLITCAECGSVFICRKRVWRGIERNEYVCNGYHRYGKSNYTPHRIDESELDSIIIGELKRLKDRITEDYDKVEENVRRWFSKKTGPTAN